jgi:hypothetical protein
VWDTISALSSVPHEGHEVEAGWSGHEQDGQDSVPA